MGAIMNHTGLLYLLGDIFVYFLEYSPSEKMGGVSSDGSLSPFLSKMYNICCTVEVKRTFRLFW